MNALEKTIRQKLEDTEQMMLKGAAADYTAYASLVARYRVLKELVDDIDERRRNNQTGDIEDND